MIVQSALSVLILFMSVSAVSINYDKIAVGELGIAIYPRVIQVLDDNSILATVGNGKYTIKINKIPTKDMTDNQKLDKMVLKRIGTFKYKNTLGVEKNIIEFEFVEFVKSTPLP